ncbi:MAG: hypothetical protein U0904_00930 [Candidatus Nanopelagicales bacterium]|nr:hypothetical protein [Candidatus Nanopelagicales bacterium]
MATRPDLTGAESSEPVFSAECRFDVPFVARLAMREKQVQQSARPVIGIHKWFARRPGSVFRSLLLAEFCDDPVSDAYWRTHSLGKIVAEPFMGGGTTVYESLRLGCSVAASDINPISEWLVREAVDPVDVMAVRDWGTGVWNALRERVSDLYMTKCLTCYGDADVKYFLWNKVCDCPSCDGRVILQPSSRIARAVRHTHEVYVCPVCQATEQVLPGSDPTCSTCARDLTRPTTVRSTATCPRCAHEFAYAAAVGKPPDHELVCIEYHCRRCYKGLNGRQFKTPDDDDRASAVAAAARLAAIEEHLPIPDDAVPAGDETDRLLRWGYKRYRDLFNDRQLLSLGTLANLIREVPDMRVRRALATVFSDFIRYQNLLCRYDVYALKCQDVFAVHGFPVGLSACENNVPGIQGVGSGGFIHFVDKYCRAKDYTQQPYEISYSTGRKKIVPTLPYPIEAPLADNFLSLTTDRRALITCAPGQSLGLPPNSVDAVLTDPPYFSNVQYSELMDFCYVWLRKLVDDEPSFASDTTRHEAEVTGNTTLGRGLSEFTAAMIAVYTAMAAALKPGGPLAFTYHHNDPIAYAPLVVAILDANLTCTDVLPAPAEMAASIHINNTRSSILDSIFVCRDAVTVGDAVSPTVAGMSVGELISRDVDAISRSGYQPTPGDIACLRAGHVAAFAIRLLVATWNTERLVGDKLALAHSTMARIPDW